jgi:hypothetical protein
MVGNKAKRFVTDRTEQGLDLHVIGELRISASSAQSGLQTMTFEQQ